MRSIDEIKAILRGESATSPADPDLEKEVAALKTVAVAANDQAFAKHLWCVGHTIEALKSYLKAYRQLQAREFFEGWCTLEQVELALGRLRPHFRDHWAEFRLAFIEKITIAIQSLYPYRLFLSPELLEESKICSICKKPVTVRITCGHKIGEVYDGEYCGRIITKFRVLGSALVRDPVQKYSVPFNIDRETRQTVDHYNYSTVEYLLCRWPEPWLNWDIEWTKALHPKSRFRPLSRNDKCPCESNKKYKKCCFSREGILRPHVIFKFHYKLSPELETTEFSN